MAFIFKENYKKLIESLLWFVFQISGIHSIKKNFKTNILSRLLCQSLSPFFEFLHLIKKFKQVASLFRKQRKFYLLSWLYFPISNILVFLYLIKILNRWHHCFKQIIKLLLYCFFYFCIFIDKNRSKDVRVMK